MKYGINILLTLLLFLAMAWSCGLFGQDIEALVKADPLKVSGGITASTAYYHAEGIDQRRPPFYWTINANLNFNFFGVVSAPFALSYSPQGDSFNYPYQTLQPFNRMGISPTYKGVTAHLGYRSMTLSKYSLAGNSFWGAGVEVNPKESKWGFAAMYGRLAQAVTEADALSNPSLVAYDRWGYGFKTSYKTTKHKLEAVLFKAWDDKSSIHIPKEFAAETPQDNLILGISTKNAITKKVDFDMEYAHSIYTRNTDGEEITLQKYSYLNNLGGFYTPRESIQFNGALETGIGYKAKQYQLRFAYKRIGPNYRTLGSPFLNNNVENYTANLSWRMLKNKISISTSGGFERNNLDKEAEEINRRLIGSVNIVYAVTSKWNLMTSYSNFNTSVVKTRITQIDSLNFFQITRSVNAGTNYQIASSEKSTHGVQLNGTYQEAFDVQDNGSLMYLGTLGYTLGKPAIGLTATLLLNANINSITGLNNPGFGPTISASKTLFQKKVRTSLTLNQLNVTSNGKVVDKTNNATMSISYSLKKSHSFGLNGSLIDKQSELTNQFFQEYRLAFQYGYRF